MKLWQGWTDPRMTRFKAMSLDEQVETLEQSAQGALRAREEMIATETTKIPQAVLVQGRGFPMALDTRERGLFMLEKAQQMIDRLQDDPDIVETTGSLADNPGRSQAGPSNPEFIDLDEITRLDDPEFTMPLVGSPTGVSAQLEIVEASQRIGTVNPLSEFIKIYDDDESPEVSLGTPMHVEEEKGPEKTSSPLPNVQTQEVPQKEKEAESVPDTKLPDASETQADSPRDEPRSGGPEERTPHQEINVSMTDEQVSIESIPTPLFQSVLKHPMRDK
jgi:hypothetical protein